MLIPKYLQEISESLEVSKDTEIIKVRCACGHFHFKVYANIEKDNPNIMYGFNEMIRENNKLYLVKRNFFGKIIERIECKDMFDKKQRKIIKVKCEKCGKEYIIFDNYKYGYDATINKIENNVLTRDEFIEFKLCYSKSIEVYIKIYQDISYNNFHNEFDNLNFEDYLCSFTNIDIYGFNSKSRRIKIYSEETA